LLELNTFWRSNSRPVGDDTFLIMGFRNSTLLVHYYKFVRKGEDEWTKHFFNCFLDISWKPEREGEIRA